MTTQLLEGSAAVAEAMVGADCRFFTGYPMTPFTEVLEHMARRLPEVGGVCLNAESELEAVGMTWGAAAAGVRAATGSTGQGLSLMQESLAEAALARVPFVVLNMARAQGDYFQATRGGGHGDYRTPVLAPMDVPEAARVVPEAFDLADEWRTPVLVLGDYYVAHTYASVDVTPAVTAPRPAPSWALDGSTSGTGSARMISPLGDTKRRDRVGYDLADFYTRAAAHTAAMHAAITPRAEVVDCDDADLVVVAYGTAAKYVRGAVATLRADGRRVGCVRPITLYPFPAAAVRSAATGARLVAVYENNQGQMVDDVRLALEGAVPTRFVGGLSLDSSGFGIAPDYDVDGLARRFGAVLDEVEGAR